MSYLRPAGKLFDSSSIVALILLGRVERVRSRQLEDAETDRRVLVEVGVDAVVERGKLDARDVLQPHDGVAALLDDDVAEFVRVGEPPERLHRDLEGAGLIAPAAD